MNSSAELPAPQTRASSANLSAAAGALKRITWSIMMPLARPWCMSSTVPSACAQECTAPRSFWKAIAPIIEAIIMSDAGRDVARLRARPRAGRGGDAYPFERDAVAQRMVGRREVALDVVREGVEPVAAVIPAAAAPSVSSGSANTARARSAAEKMIFFTCVLSSEMTLERPTSLPVPLVVGSATKYGSGCTIGRTWGWSHAYSRTSPSWTAMSATTLATSSAAPPPKPINAVGIVRLERRDAGVDLRSRRVAEDAGVNLHGEAGKQRGGTPRGSAARRARGRSR